MYMYMKTSWWSLQFNWNGVNNYGTYRTAIIEEAVLMINVRKFMIHLKKKIPFLIAESIFVLSHPSAVYIQCRIERWCGFDIQRSILCWPGFWLLSGHVHPSLFILVSCTGIFPFLFLKYSLDINVVDLLHRLALQCKNINFSKLYHPPTRYIEIFEAIKSFERIESLLITSKLSSA